MKHLELILDSKLTFGIRIKSLTAKKNKKNWSDTEISMFYPDRG